MPAVGLNKKERSNSVFSDGPHVQLLCFFLLFKIVSPVARELPEKELNGWTILNLHIYAPVLLICKKKTFNK